MEGQCGMFVKADSTHAGAPGAIPSASRENKIGSWFLLPDSIELLNWSINTINRGALYHCIL